MKVILELEYHSAEWSVIWLFNALKEKGINTRLFKFEKDSANPRKETPKDTYYSISFIKRVVSIVTTMPEVFFEKASRKLEIAENRQIAMYLCRKYTRKSLREIGQEFGGKTPATIMHACKAIQNLAHTDKKFQIKLEAIEKELETTPNSTN